MYYKHKRWLEDCVTEDRIIELLKRRKEKHYEIIYLKYEYDKALSIYGSAHLAYHRALREYREIDLDLALVDGRYSLILEPVKTIRKRRDIKKAVKALSREQRLSLLEELKKIK